MPLLVIFCHVAIAADDRFPINRVQVDGNTILPPADVDRAVGRAVGPQQAYGDIQRALEALELAYRKAGYSAVLVRLPEQELTEGVVKITVSESTVGRVTVVGNKYFDEANIRSSLRNLQVGRTPNLRAMSEAIQLANDNPAKQVEVTLASSTVENQVDAKITVFDSNPVRTTLTLDNTGTPATGKLRTGVGRLHHIAGQSGRCSRQSFFGRLSGAAVCHRRQHRSALRRLQRQHARRLANLGWLARHRRQGQRDQSALEPFFCARRYLHQQAGLER